MRTPTGCSQVHWRSRRRAVSVRQQRPAHCATRLGMTTLALLAAGAGAALSVLPSTPAAAAPTATCTWTGTTNGDWSVGTNWTGGAACTVPGGPASGSALVFPPVDTTEDVFYDSGSEGGGGGAVPASEFDSMTFQDRYTIVPDGGPSSITMTPTAATPCGASTTIALCQSGSAASFIGTDLVMGESEEFSALTGTDGIVLLGSLSGPGPLLANVTAGSGSVVLTGADSYTGGTILGSGLLAGDSPSAFGNPAGAVTADNGGTVQICAPITVDYSLHLGDSAALMAGCGTATWSGPITVDSGGAEILNAGSTSTLTVSGNISGSDPLAIQTFASVESSILSGDNSTYSGTITVESGATLASEPAVAGNTPLGTGAVVVDAGGTLEGTGPVPSVDNAGTFAPGTTTTPGLFTSSGSDNLGPGTIDVAITGPTAGSGYAQFANSTSEVDVDGATLAVDDTYAAPYGTVFHVVSLSGSASEVGAFAGDPSGTVINSNGHLLKIAYSPTTGVTLTDVTDPPSPPSPSPSGSSGYRLVASDGGLFSYHATFDGSMGGHQLNAPIVGMATDSVTGGYFEVASDGGIFAFDAPFHGSMGGQHLNASIVGIAFDSVTGGYYEVASDGGIFAFDAPFHGSMGGHHLSAPIVGIVSDSVTGGYYEVASDGGIFAFDAPFHGSEGGRQLKAPIVGMAFDSVTGGYYEVASDGGIFAFGAPLHGSMGSQHLNQPIVGIAFDSVTGGYYEVASDGGIFAFDAPFQGSAGAFKLNRPVVGMSFA